MNIGLSCLALRRSRASLLLGPGKSSGVRPNVPLRRVSSKRIISRPIAGNWIQPSRLYVSSTKTPPPTASQASKSNKNESPVSTSSTKPESKPSPAPATPTNLSSFRLAVGDNHWHATPGMKLTPQFHMPSLFVDEHNPPPSIPADIHCTYGWYRGPLMETVQLGLVAHARPEIKDPTQWTKLSAKRTYTPTAADAMHLLKFEIYADYKPGKPVTSENATTNAAPLSSAAAAASAAPLPSKPITAGKALYFIAPTSKSAPTRTMSARKTDFETDMLPDAYSFTAMSWNILARRYTDRQRLSNCPDYALTWDYRKELIVEDNLLVYAPDVISLQECEQDAYEDHLHPILKSHGYGSVFEKRGSVLHDGCATFYKKSKFRLISTSRVDFDDLDQDKELKALPYPSAHFLTHNIATITCLEIKAPEQRLENVYGKRFVYVVNAHQFWDPQSPEIKLLQSEYLFKRLSAFKTKMHASKSIPIDTPVLLNGDFNSTHESAVYDYITQGTINITDSRADIPVSDLLRTKNIKNEETLLNALVAHGDAPTNLTINFSGCLDYIFHSPALVPTAVLENPITSKSEELRKSILTDDYMGCIPNPSYPSDHLPLMVQFSVAMNPTM